MESLLILIIVAINSYMISVSAFRRPIFSRLSSATRLTRLQTLHTTSELKPKFQEHGENKHYDFKTVESNLYSWWEKSGYFSPKPSKEKFIVPMPPPNITGFLHMGHAIFIALQDIVARFKRMRGLETLWVPGT